VRILKLIISLVQKKYIQMVIYSDSVKSFAKKLFLQNQSLEEIANALKTKWKKDCKNIHRSTVQTWIKKENWEKEKSKIASSAIKKAKTKKLTENNDNLEDLKRFLDNYQAESYEVDSELRAKTFIKLKSLVDSTDINLLNARLFLDIFRISTSNIARLHEIANPKDDDNKLLDELLKIRGINQNE
jgi:hypothetical protein